jgi:DNA-binding winged helix-turn-helix (wHTH) protein
MSQSTPKSELYEFGPFRLDVAERVLTKGPQVIPLTPKAFDTLVVLLRHSGHVVDKDELLKEVWPDTFVEEGILAVNVAAIRKALSEGEEGRSYIETVPRRGYRFVGEVRQTAKASEDGAAAGEPPEIKRSGIVPWGLAAGLLALVSLAIGWYVSRSRPTSIPPPSSPIPLTSYPGTELSPTFSPDGSQVAFSWDGEHQDNFDIYVKQVDRADAVRLTSDPARDMSPAWSPDGRYIAFAREGAVFLIPPTGGTERKVAEVRAGDIEWTRDSKSLIVSARTLRECRLLRVSVDTGEPTELTSPPGGQDFSAGDFNVALSPDGLNVAFVRYHTANVLYLYLMPLTGGEPRRLTQNESQVYGVTWTADGREIVYSSPTTLRRRSVEAPSDSPSERVGGVDPARAVGHPSFPARHWDMSAWPTNVLFWTRIFGHKIPRNHPHRRAN